MGEEQMGGVIVCDKVCLGVVLSSSLLSCEKSPSSLIDEYPGEGIYDKWDPFGGSDFWQMNREFRDRLSLHLLFFRCLWLKIITIPKWPVLRRHVLLSSGSIQCRIRITMMRTRTRGKADGRMLKWTSLRNTWWYWMLGPRQRVGKSPLLRLQTLG